MKMFKFMARRLSRSEEGFTLIELLVVVAIIALLATFAVPKLFDAINKSKKAPGQADLQTISGALERFYMDNNKYPLAAAAKTDLAPGYVKTGTTFYNGYTKGYAYVTDATGSYYILLDAENEALITDLTITCNAKLQVVRVGDKDLSFYTSTTLAGADVAKGCAVSGATAGIKTSIVTN